MNWTLKANQKYWNKACQWYMKDNKIYPFHSDWGGYGIIAPSFRES